MKLIVGLGNPGPQYKETRHNIGFTILESLQKKLQFEDFKEEKKFHSLISKGIFENQQLILAKPLTFMNLSGKAIQAIASFYKISPQEILVIYDDLDLPFGNLRIRKSGGPGTHNGMKSIAEVLGENFPRLRFGIESRGENHKEKTTSFVLSRFSKEENIKQALEKSVNAIESILKDPFDTAMNRYNI